MQKWAAFEVIPAGIGLVFLAVHASLLLYQRIVLGQTSWERAMRHLDSLIAQFLVLFYFLFLQVTCAPDLASSLCYHWHPVTFRMQLFKLQLDVFDCSPLDPPDGKLYLLSVFQECGIPGGIQLTLMPWAIITLIAYYVSYPVFLGYLFYTKRCVLRCNALLRWRECMPSPPWAAQRAHHGRPAHPRTRRRR